MRSTRTLLGLVAAAAGIATLAWRRLAPFPVRVRGASMAPTLQDGDLVLATSRLSPRAGDLVVVESRGMEMIKRVTSMLEHAVTLQGDNATASTNFVGDLGDIRGVALARYWPNPRVLLTPRRP